MAGQRPIVPEDLARLPEVLALPDRVYMGGVSGRRKLRRWFFEKGLGDDFVATVEAEPASKSLFFVSLRISRRTEGGDGQPR